VHVHVPRLQHAQRQRDHTDVSAHLLSIGGDYPNALVAVGHALHLKAVFDLHLAR
jgi:hypothetical protein